MRLLDQLRSLGEEFGLDAFVSIASERACEKTETLREIAAERAEQRRLEWKREHQGRKNKRQRPDFGAA